MGGRQAGGRLWLEKNFKNQGSKRAERILRKKEKDAGATQAGRAGARRHPARHEKTSPARAEAVCLLLRRVPSGATVRRAAKKFAPWSRGSSPRS